MCLGQWQSIQRTIKITQIQYVANCRLLVLQCLVHIAITGLSTLNWISAEGWKWTNNFLGLQQRKLRTSKNLEKTVQSHETRDRTGKPVLLVQIFRYATSCRLVNSYGCFYGQQHSAMFRVKQYQSSFGLLALDDGSTSFLWDVGSYHFRSKCRLLFTNRHCVVF